MLQTTQWDNSAIYLDFSDPQINADLVQIKKSIQQIGELAEVFHQALKDLASDVVSTEDLITKAQEIYGIQLNLSSDLMTLSVFAQSQMSTNSQHEQAKILASKVSQLSNELTSAF